MSAGLYRFLKDDGKAVGTQGWRAEHDSSSCTVHTGLWRGNKVVALLVVEGHYDDIADELKAEGERIARACNEYQPMLDQLAAAGARVRELEASVADMGKALQTITDSHKFNVASLPPHEVHELAYVALNNAGRQ